MDKVEKADLNMLLRGHAATTDLGAGVVVLDVKRFSSEGVYLSAALHEFYHNKYPEETEEEIHKRTMAFAKGLKFSLDIAKVIDPSTLDGLGSLQKDTH